MDAAAFLKEEEFNLLLLQDNECYFLDSDSLELQMTQAEKDVQQYVGILRLTSESIIFQCHCPQQQTSIDLLKFHFESIQCCTLYSIKHGQSVSFSLCLESLELIRIPVVYVTDTLRGVTSHILDKTSPSSPWRVCLSPTVLKTTPPQHQQYEEVHLSCEECLHELLNLTETNLVYLQNSSPEALLKFIYYLISVFLYDRSVKSQPAKALPQNSIMQYSRLIHLISNTIPSCSSFSLSHLKSTHEKLIHPVLQVDIQLPLHRAKCLLALTDAALYYKVHPSRKGSAFERLSWTTLQHAIYRIVDLAHTGLLFLFCWNIELHEASWEELSFNFISERERYAVVRAIKSFCPNAFLLCEDDQYIQHFSRLWVQGHLDSYHYLQVCNYLGNRTEMDFSQYPVMPWTISDFSSSTVNLASPKSFRDLSLPIGAINKQRLSCLQERMQNTQEMSSPLTFLYGSHYSTPGYIVYWLSREIPESLVRLQGGRLEAWPRLFHSIAATWNCLQDGRDGSSMELIPHFYCPNRKSFLENHLGINIPYGQNSSEKNRNWVHPTLGVLPDVELPSWSNNDAFIAVKVLREALESPVVSKSLHQWIDLTFGYKQRGKEAEEAMNVYHPITYLTSLMAQGGGEAHKSLKSITDSLGLSYGALITQVQEFGQAPVMIFKEPHAKRSVLDVPKELDLSNLQSLTDFPRSCYPWFVHILQHPHLQYSSPFLGPGPSKTLPLHCTTKDLSKPYFPHDPDEESFLRFKKSEVLSLFKKEEKENPSIVSLHESIHDPCVLLFGCQDGTLRQLNINEPKTSYPAIPCSSVSITAMLSIEKDIVVIGDSLGMLRLAKTEYCSHSNLFTAKDSPHLDSVISIVASSFPVEKQNHRVLCSAWSLKVSSDCLLGVWDITPSGEPRLISSVDQEISCISMQDSVFITGGYNGEVRVWDLRCFSTGPIWGAEAWNSRETSRLHVAHCYLVPETLESFSLVGYVKDTTCRQMSLKTLSCLAGHETWEVLLCDMRMLAPSNLPLPTNIKHSLTARYAWGPETLLYNVSCDGQQWAIGTGVMTFNHPPIDLSSDVTSSNFPHTPSTCVAKDTLCYFASAVDLSYGFHSRQICRWPLLLTESPRFIASPALWNIGKKKQNSSLPQLWLANEYGAIELIY